MTLGFVTIYILRLDDTKQVVTLCMRSKKEELRCSSEVVKSYECQPSNVFIGLDQRPHSIEIYFYFCIAAVHRAT